MFNHSLIRHLNSLAFVQTSPLPQQKIGRRDSERGGTSVHRLEFAGMFKIEEDFKDFFEVQKFLSFLN